jgi:hypothetical protein
MKPTTAMFLNCALYTVLVFMPPMLPAAEVEAPIQDLQTAVPRPPEGEQGKGNAELPLTPDQLDSVKAGQEGIHLKYEGGLGDIDIEGNHLKYEGALGDIDIEGNHLKYEGALGDIDLTLR